MASSLAGCIDLADDSTQGGNGKADGNGTCTVPEYGDGTCQIDIACDVPDVDCYTPFDTDQAAAAWLATQMQYTPVGETDPRFTRARKLVDQAYDLYRKHVQLGAMADKRLSVVVLEGSENAFVAGDYMTHKGAWTIHVQAALLDAKYTDDQIIGVFQHELTHLRKLHFIDEVVERTRKFYVAPDGKEPIGEQVTQSAQAQTIGSAWRTSAKLAGSYTNPELGDLPFTGQLGEIFGWFVQDYCPNQQAALASVTSALDGRLSHLDETLTIDAPLADQIRTALATVQTCTPAMPMTLRQYLDAQSPEWTMYITKLLAAEDLPLLDTPALDALVKLVHVHRTAMTALQTRLPAETGRPWSALRYYSYEEQADDNWVRIYDSAKLDGAASVRGAFLSMLGADAAACETALGGVPPYGANLTDEHHETCWRIFHAKQIQDATSTSTARVIVDETDTSQRVPHVPAQLPRPPGPIIVY